MHLLIGCGAGSTLMWLAWWLRDWVSAEACGPGAQEKQSRMGLADRALCAGLAEYASGKDADRGAVACPALGNQSSKPSIPAAGPGDDAARLGHGHHRAGPFSGPAAPRNLRRYG